MITGKYSSPTMSQRLLTTYHIDRLIETNKMNMLMYCKLQNYYHYYLTMCTINTKDDIKKSSDKQIKLTNIAKKSFLYKLFLK